MIFSVTVIPATATANSEDTYITSDESSISDETFDLPDIVDSQEATENDYVGRVNSEEKDLYTFIFKNGNGTNTMRVYSHPVKYISKDGTVRDISLDIKKNSDGVFVTADHEIITSFERKLTDGISLKYNDVDVTLIPKLSVDAPPTASLSTDSRKVTYKLNDTTSYVYELTYAGFKEDIVVSEYTGQTEYKFRIYTNGLTLHEESESFFLIDERGTVKATIGDIIVFTADERNNTMGSMTYSTIKENREYELTIHLDPEYLADDDTAYPIRIDPTVEISYDNNGAGAIEDVTVNQSTTFGGTSGSLYVGRRPDGSLSRALMRFPNLEMPVPFSPMILSAQVELRDIMCQGNEDMTIECYSYTESCSNWSESGTTTWSGVGASCYNTLLDSHLVSYGQGNISSQRYAFDITDIAKLWADGSSSPSKGLVFKASSAFEGQSGSGIQYWYKTFASYNRATNKPSLKISYETKAVFTIRQTNYLIASSQGIGGATFSTSLGSLTGNNMWCVEYIPEHDSFSIVSMGIRGTNGVYPCEIYNTDTVVGLGIQAKNSSYHRYIISKTSVGGFSIKNEAYDNYLSVSGLSLSLSSYINSTAIFGFTRIDTSIFTDFRTGAYLSGMVDGVAHIKILLDSSIYGHDLFKDNDFSAALWWNGMSENVIIYGPNDAVPSGIMPFYVTFAADTGLNMHQYGATVPDGIPFSVFYELDMSEQKSRLNSDWHSVTIYLNGNTSSTNNAFYRNIADSYKRERHINKIICHEMGHALKLVHPNESRTNGNKHWYTGCRDDYPNNMSVYSVMNSGLFYSEIDILTASVPQAHDCINLISKWKYHINCTH